MIHPLAHHDSTVVIGERTRIWQFASIIRGAVIGEDCNIASCTIVDGAVIGDRCIIGHGSSVHPGTKIGSDVFVGPAATFCNDAWPRVSKDGFDVALLIGAGRPSIVVEDEASIGAGATVLPGVRIGKGAMVAAGASVRHSVPAGHLHKRDGSIVLLRLEKPLRMREAP